jgi:hypothetical protein
MNICCFPLAQLLRVYSEIIRKEYRKGQIHKREVFKKISTCENPGWELRCTTRDMHKGDGNFPNVRNTLKEAPYDTENQNQVIYRHFRELLSDTATYSTE